MLHSYPYGLMFSCMPEQSGSISNSVKRTFVFYTSLLFHLCALFITQWGTVIYLCIMPNYSKHTCRECWQMIYFLHPLWWPEICRHLFCGILKQFVTYYLSWAWSRRNPRWAAQGQSVNGRKGMGQQPVLAGWLACPESVLGDTYLVCRGHKSPMEGNHWRPKRSHNRTTEHRGCNRRLACRLLVAYWGITKSLTHIPVYRIEMRRATNADCLWSWGVITLKSVHVGNGRRSAKGNVRLCPCKNQTTGH